MLHALVVANLQGHIVLEQFWDGDEPAAVKRRPDWKSFFAQESQALNRAREEEHLIAFRSDRCVVYCRTGELVVYICGSDEDQDVVLSEVLGSVVLQLKSVCKRGQANEKDVVENFAKVRLSLDEVASGAGDVLLTDPNMIRRGVKMSFAKES